MNFAHRLGLSALISASALFSGCATTSDSQQAQDRAVFVVDSKAATGMIYKVLGVYAGQKAGEVAAAGDLRRAQSLEIASAGAIAMGDYEHQKAIAETGKSQVNVNINVPSQYPRPTQTQAIQPVKLRAMTATGWNDLNGDGLIKYPEEIVNRKSRFHTNENIQGILYGENNPSFVVKAAIRDAITDSIVIESNTVMPPHGMIAWKLPPSKPGLYLLSFTDQQGNLLGETLFRIDLINSSRQASNKLQERL